MEKIQVVALALWKVKQGKLKQTFNSIEIDFDESLLIEKESKWPLLKKH